MYNRFLKHVFFYIQSNYALLANIITIGCWGWIRVKKILCYRFFRSG